MLFAGLSQGCSMIAGQGPVPEVLAPEGALTTLNNFLATCVPELLVASSGPTRKWRSCDRFRR